MDVIETFADCEGQESAQVTLFLERTGEHVVSSRFGFRKTENQTEDDIEGLPLVDYLVRLLGQSIETDDDDEEQALDNEALDLICDAATSPNSEGTSSDEIHELYNV